MKLSIIVCTRNRACALVPCLDSITASLAQAAPPDAEIVVVDNASDDNTSAVVRKWANKCAFPVNLLLEPKKGLASARNCGIRGAKGDLIVWTDDDCRLDRDYITAALRHDSADNEPVLRGGRVELGDPADLPFSIKTSPAAERWQKDQSPRRIWNLDTAIIGANMTMSRALIDRVGLFDERFGAGSAIPGGEETDYIFRAWLAGMAIEYVPDMVIYHYHGRKLKAEGNKLLRSYMISTGALYSKYIFKYPDFCRPAYGHFKNALKEIISGKNNYMPEMELSYKGMMVHYTVGAAKYLAASLKRSQSGKRP